MNPRAPISELTTHDVTNQVPPLEHYDAFGTDRVLCEALEREGAGWARARCAELGKAVGRPEVIEQGFDANQHVPRLKTHDRYGHRIDEVDFHPAYHQLMDLAFSSGLPTIAWTSPDKPGAHVAHSALTYLFGQVEQGVVCPMTMTYAVVPVLQRHSDVGGPWLPKILEGSYDPRCIPAEEKTGVTFGMAMTEKQGGSDVRANTTRAAPLGPTGPGEAYLLTGHKWFCSAPMSDAFLTLAHTERGLSCFLVPRWRPDGTRNPFFIQRLKDKLGNRSNASSEIEYVQTYGRMIGEEGRGVRTILEMVHHTRLDTAVAPVGLMRQGLVQAVHHATHRKAFGKRLIEQPLMRNVLADLALETEAGLIMAMRVARSFDEGPHDEHAARFGRLATAVTKYWLNKRVAEHVNECMECLGGAGYIEEGILARLYREAPLNGIWEGSGNVICLDVLRAMHRDPGCLEAVLAEVKPVAAGEPRLARVLDQVTTMLREPESLEARARLLVERLAKLLQGALVIQHAPSPVADAYCRARLEPDGGEAYGALPAGVDVDALIDRVGLVS